MSLGDDLEAAEQRVRNLVNREVANCQVIYATRGPGADDSKARDHYRAALDRYGAVCRLAGRWTEHMGWHGCGGVDCGYGPAAELARLMEGCG